MTDPDDEEGMGTAPETPPVLVVLFVMAVVIAAALILGGFVIAVLK